MVPRPRNGLSLCSGGGGLDMGLGLIEPDFHARCFVEIEKDARDVLVAAMEAGCFAPAPIWDDLKTFDARPFAGAFDTLLAGYPCQPFSQAGQRKGADDPRHLWPDIMRIIRELGDGLRWVILENVEGHVSLGAETVLRDLWEMGFTPATGLFTASETGAPHKRERWFCVAYKPSRGCRERGDAALAGRGRHPDGQSINLEHSRQPQRARCTGGRFDGAGRPTSRPCEGERELADPSERRQRGSQEGQDQQPRGTEVVWAGFADMADACRARLQGRERFGASSQGRKGPYGPVAEHGRPLLHPPGPSARAGWSAVLSVAPDLAPALSVRDAACRAQDLGALVASGNMAEAEAEPALRRMVDGLARRTRALRLLGNGVHPLAAANALRSLFFAHGLRPLDLAAGRGRERGSADAPMVRAVE